MPWPPQGQNDSPRADMGSWDLGKVRGVLGLSKERQGWWYPRALAVCFGKLVRMLSRKGNPCA